MNTELSAFTPTQVGQYIKRFMDRDRILSGLMVRGELSNYKMYPSGHHYFTLKDREGALRCVMFRGDAGSLRFRPQNGMQVIASGRITVFPRDGQYQMYCTRLIPVGTGDLHLAFEQLKEKLYQEGMFAVERKRPLPTYPSTIALVTSPVGAAVRDMIRILGARWPLAEIKILPVRVQGTGASEEIADAIRWANRNRVADLIITGRGGGSLEDLWAFNEEIVARAIFESEIPVVSAVGHEPDVTISDFVADLRAATPSNAAELSVPDQNELYAALQGMEHRLQRSMMHQLSEKRMRLKHSAQRRILQDPNAFFQDRRMMLDYQSRRLFQGVSKSLLGEKNRLVGLAASLDAMSPLKVLGRGYAIAQKENGLILTKTTDARPGEPFDLRLSDGILKCHVNDDTQ